MLGALTLLGPTRLVTPEDLGPAGQAAASSTTLGIIVAIAAAASLVLMFVSRRRKIEPKERAFRVVTKRMRLTNGQRKSLRKRAKSAGVEPIALVACPRSARMYEQKSRSRDRSGVLASLGTHTRNRPSHLAAS